MITLNNYFNKLVKVALEEKQALMDDSIDTHLQVMDKSAKSPDFFHENNSNKPERKYTTTRIKSRNFLLNIPYVGINKTFTTKMLYSMCIC